MTKIFKKTGFLSSLVVIGCSLVISLQVHAHCQIPCGIYDDYARLLSMLEDTATIEKSAKMMAELAAKTDAQSQNQYVRWVMNKEKHSQNVIDTISDYFLTQRVKSSQQDYTERLIKHHRVIVAAMKTKQNADSRYTTELKSSIDALASYYPQHQH